MSARRADHAAALRLIASGFAALANAIEAEPDVAAPRRYTRGAPRAGMSWRSMLETARRCPSIKTFRFGRTVEIDVASFEAAIEGHARHPDAHIEAPAGAESADAATLAAMGWPLRAVQGGRR